MPTVIWNRWLRLTGIKEIGMLLGRGKVRGVQNKRTRPCSSHKDWWGHRQRPPILSGHPVPHTLEKWAGAMMPNGLSLRNRWPELAPKPPTAIMFPLSFQQGTPLPVLASCNSLPPAVPDTAGYPTTHGNPFLALRWQTLCVKEKYTLLLYPSAR